MGFLKKLGKGIGKIAGKVVKPAVGFAAKIVGGLNIPVISGGANLVGKLVKSIPDGGSKVTTAKIASAASAPPPQNISVTDVLGDVKKIANSGDWFKKNWGWVIFPPVALILLIVVLVKRKR